MEDCCSQKSKNSQFSTQEKKFYSGKNLQFLGKGNFFSCAEVSKDIAEGKVTPPAEFLAKSRARYA